MSATDWRILLPGVGNTARRINHPVGVQEISEPATHRAEPVYFLSCAESPEGGMEVRHVHGRCNRILDVGPLSEGKKCRLLLHRVFMRTDQQTNRGASI